MAGNARIIDVKKRTVNADVGSGRKLRIHSRKSEDRIMSSIGARTIKPCPVSFLLHPEEFGTGLQKRLLSLWFEEDSELSLTTGSSCFWYLQNHKRDSKPNTGQATKFGQMAVSSGVRFR